MALARKTLRFSVVTPSYQQGRFIERTLRSVLDQHFPGLEYVVFDGGSKDETVRILRRYESRLRWVSEKDRGQTHAVNKGLRATSGDIIGWLNSDDVFFPKALRAVADCFTAHPEVDVVYGKADHIDEHDVKIESYGTEPFNLERLKDVCFFCQPAVFFRRRVVDKFGLLDERLRYCMDYEYWVRLALGGARFFYLNQKLAGSRLYADTKTLGARRKVHAEINAMLRGKLGRVPDRWVFNYAHVRADEIGVSRSSRWFPYVVGLLSLISSFRWKASISAWRTSLNWLTRGNRS